MPSLLIKYVTLTVFKFKSEQFMEDDQFHFVFVINLMGLCLETATKVKCKTE